VPEDAIEVWRMVKFFRIVSLSGIRVRRQAAGESQLADSGRRAPPSMATGDRVELGMFELWKYSN
jgi:hypothetical protein